MKYTEIITAPEAIKGFYPTPKKLAEMLLDGVEFDNVRTVLEPSVGKGDLAIQIAIAAYERTGYGRRDIEIDACEIDPALRAAASTLFGSDANHKRYQRMDELRGKRYASEQKGIPYEQALSPKDKRALDAVHDEYYAIENTAFRIMHDDFLSFHTYKQYDLIVMNPPFQDGHRHLMKAIEMQKRYGGKIRCILNAETVRNPATKEKLELSIMLKELGAGIRYVKKGFVDAERKTSVEVALISIDIQAPELHSDLFARLTRAEEEKEAMPDATTDLALNSLFGRMVSMYNVECQAGLELIREYKALVPHILTSLDPSDYTLPTIELRIGDSRFWSVNSFLRLTRNKYWQALFHNPTFTSRLPQKMKDTFQGQVNKMKDYDFTVFNIMAVVQEMNAGLRAGVEQAIDDVFEKLTAKHSYYDDCANNIHYYSGWKTTKAHYINKKVIIPAYGVFATDSIFRRNKFDAREAVSNLWDIEKVLDFFTGEITAEVNLSHVMVAVSEAVERHGALPKNISCKHFSVTFYKKGTVHITFHDQELLDRFNIYCSRHRNWLPPNYGKVHYKDMTAEERAAVDGFHGDGTECSGEAAYAKVMENPSKYILEPTHSAPALMAPSSAA